MPDIVVLDEVAFVEDATLRALMPIIATAECVVAASTPSPWGGWFREEWVAHFLKPWRERLPAVEEGHLPGTDRLSVLGGWEFGIRLPWSVMPNRNASWRSAEIAVFGEDRFAATYGLQMRK